ncbi:MAG: SEL1-like repeat protein [Candidatus Woesearchaeota archaeon]|jgi:hypothetical protein
MTNTQPVKDKQQIARELNERASLILRDESQESFSRLGRAQFVKSLCEVVRDYSSLDLTNRDINNAINTFRFNDNREDALKLAIDSHYHATVLELLGNTFEAVEYAEKNGLIEEKDKLYHSLFDKAQSDDECRGMNRAALGIARLSFSNQFEDLVKVFGDGPEKLSRYSEIKKTKTDSIDPDEYVGKAIEIITRKYPETSADIAIINLMGYRVNNDQPCVESFFDRVRNRGMELGGIAGFRESPFGYASIIRLNSLLNLRYGSARKPEQVMADKDNINTLAGQAVVLMQSLERIADVNYMEWKHHSFELRDAPLTSAAEVARALGFEEDRRRIVKKMTDAGCLIQLGNDYAKEDDIENAHACYRKAIKYEWRPGTPAIIARDLLKDLDLAIELYKKAADNASASLALNQEGGFNTCSLNALGKLSRGLDNKRDAILSALQIIERRNLATDNDEVSRLKCVNNTLRDLYNNLTELNLTDSEQVNRCVETFHSIGLDDYAGVISHITGRARLETGNISEANSYFEKAIQLYSTSDWLLQAAIAADDMKDVTHAKELRVQGVRKLASMFEYSQAIRTIREYKLEEITQEITLTAIEWAEKENDHSFVGFYCNQLGLTGKAMQNYWKNPANGDRDNSREYALLVFSRAFGGNGRPTFDGFWYEDVPDFKVVRQKIVEEYGESEKRDTETQNKMDRDRNDVNTVIGQVTLAIDYYLQLKGQPQYMKLDHNTNNIAAYLALVIEDEDQTFNIWKNNFSPFNAAVELYSHGRQDEGLSLLQRIEQETNDGEGYSRLSSAFEEIGFTEEAKRVNTLAMNAFLTEKNYSSYFYAATRLSDNPKAIILGGVYMNYSWDNHVKECFDTAKKIAESNEELKEYMQQICTDAIPTLVDNGRFDQAQRCAEFIGDQKRIAFYTEITNVIKGIKELTKKEVSEW